MNSREAEDPFAMDWSRYERPGYPRRTNVEAYSAVRSGGGSVRPHPLFQRVHGGEAKAGYESTWFSFAAWSDS